MLDYCVVVGGAAAAAIDRDLQGGVVLVARCEKGMTRGADRYWHNTRCPGKGEASEDDGKGSAQEPTHLPGGAT